MALTKTKLSKDNVSVEINLEPLLGKLAEDRAVRETFFELALERLLERTASGRDVNGNLFPKYSSAYKNSLAFKVFGKDNTPNLELTGDMLGSISQESTSKKMIVAVSEDEAPKAYNHMTGDTMPKRPFLGWKDSELQDIAKEFKPLVRQAERSNVSDAQIERLLDRLSGDDDGES